MYKEMCILLYGVTAGLELLKVNWKTRAYIVGHVNVRSNLYFPYKCGWYLISSKEIPVWCYCKKWRGWKLIFLSHVCPTLCVILKNVLLWNFLFNMYTKERNQMISMDSSNPSTLWLHEVLVIAMTWPSDTEK